MKVFIAVVVVTMVAAVSGASIDTSELVKDINCVFDEALKAIKDPALQKKLMEIQIETEKDIEDGDVDEAEIENQIKSILQDASQNFIDTWQNIVKVCKLDDSAPSADDTASAPSAPADDAAAAPPADDTQSADGS